MLNNIAFVKFYLKNKGQINIIDSKRRNGKY